MRLIHIASYKDEFFNGIKTVLEELIPAQRAIGQDVWILNHELNSHPVIEGEQYVKGICDFINQIKLVNPDLVIFHSLYALDDVLFSLYLRYRNIPYVVEPHGGTSKENARKNYLKKQIANIAYANDFLSHAAGLIYLNVKESKDCVFSKIRRNYAVIPNGTSIHGIVGMNKSAEVIKFVFLARIDIVQKGLDLLFPAIEEINRRGLKEKVEFHFYGKARISRWEQMFGNYIKKADSNVFYHGPVVGKDKENAFQNSDIFILTSRYEGMPMAVLEALSYGLPCILTPQTNLADVITEKGCGWIVEPTIESICDGIITAVNYFHEHRKLLMNNALDAARMFRWSSIAAHSVREYTRMMEDLK